MLMSKLYTTVFLCGLVICFLFCPVILLSQNTPSLKDIKRSGKYYSGDGYDTDTIKAREAARTDLMANISKQIKDVNSLNGKSEILVKYIQYLVKPLGEDGYVKVVAFVLVENVIRIIKDKKPLVVTEMKYTEEKTPPEKEELQNKPTTVPDKKEESQNKPTMVFDEKTEPRDIAPDAKNEMAPLVQNTLLERLVACDTSIELGRILEKEKSNNKLIYSVSEAFRKNNSPENFYIVLINPDTKKIVSFFNMGNSERKDLKYGKKSVSIENDAKNLIQVWVQLF